MKASHVAAGRDAAIIAFGIDPNESSRDARVSLNALAQRYPELAVHVHATVGSKAAVRQVTDALGYHYAFDPRIGQSAHAARSEEHTSELQSLMRISYAVFCLTKKKHHV